MIPKEGLGVICKADEKGNYQTVTPDEKNEIKGVTLTPDEIQKLKNGEQIFVEGMKSNQGKEFNANLQYSAERRGIEFIFPKDQAFNQQTLGGVPLSLMQLKALNEGHTILVEDMKRKSMNKTNHHIYKAEQIDWEKLESVGISRLQIEKDRNMDLLLQGEETNVMSIKIKTPVFSLTIDATLSLIEDENGNPVISINDINPSGE